MSSPLEEPVGNWWDRPVDRRETLWLGIAGAWSLAIFGWMTAFTRVGEQNPVGRSRSVDPEAYAAEVAAYKEAADETDDGLVPPADEVYVGAQRFRWDGLPVVLEAGREYEFHFGAYDVQHGFSIRPEGTLSKQMNLQMIPGQEWVMPFTFDEPDVYHVMCNEFCGHGHRTMHGTIRVRG